MMPLAAKEPAAPAEHVSSSNVPSFCSSSVLHDSALTKSDDTSPKEEFIQKLNSTPIELPAPREIISLSSVSSSVVSSSTVEDNTSRCVTILRYCFFLVYMPFRSRPCQFAYYLTFVLQV